MAMDLYAGTTDGLYRLGEGERERVADGDVRALAVEHDGLWAVLDGVVLARGGDGGLEEVARHERTVHCLLAIPGGLLAGTAEGGLVRLEGDHLVEVEGFAAAPGREDWYTPWGGPPDTRSLASAPDGTLFANVHVGGIARSRDAGGTWEPTIDVDADVHQVVVADGRVLAAAAEGLAVSDDEGETWRWETGGLHATYARAVAVAGEDVLVSASEGPGGKRSGLYRREAGGGAALRRCRAGLPEWFSGNIDTYCLVAAGESVAAADGGTVYHSVDGGETWSVLARDLPEVRCLAVRTVVV